ncbi:catalase [Shouchella shacheensis]|uniref:catalase n=1 Tax=Shouchella shacheensis TaxID=1649580 RepID=UPI00073FC9CF|nr:catalase [Shouchella shacheensis]
MENKPSSKNKKPVDGTSKQEQLDQHRVQNTGKPLTTKQGVKISNDEQVLKAGERGPSLQEDFHFQEKMAQFAREEIPERVVHARGYGAHGVFECYESMSHLTKAGFLQEPGKKTPVFVRFSTVQGDKGSYDTARDIRCWGTKFYTEEGNYDLTSLSFPAFAVQDVMKFVDIMHAYQPEPRTDIPTAAGAHDNFWDFVASNQETAHMVLWVMSDRGILRSYRMFESWAINTYLFVNEQGKATFVRFVWKPVLGAHSFLQDEALALGGLDPDFHRRDLKEAIDRGAYPEYELGVQLVAMEDEFNFDFDVLDPSKFWPEEVIPVHCIGKLTLNKNVDNHFAETEQSAFNPANVVPGIDFSNDPVLQGRLFVYKDTQHHRLGSANYEELPINRPICPFHNNQRRGAMRHRIDVDQVSYHKNSLAGNTPYTTPPQEGGYAHYPRKVEGYVTRGRSESFNDFFSQARIFWNSMTPVEKQHIIEAFSYQLGNVQSASVRQQVVDMYVNVDKEMASIIADNVGVDRPSGSHVPVSTSYPSLSQANQPTYAYTQKVGVLIGDGFNRDEVTSVLNTLKQQGVFVEVVSDQLGTVTGSDGTEIKVDQSFLTSSPFMLDALYVVGGHSNNEVKFNQDLTMFIREAYEHYKPIGVATTAQSYFQHASPGVVFAADNPTFADEFVAAIGQHRFWDRR